MAAMSAVALNIVPSPTQVGRSNVTVSYVVTFDGFDIASDQPYWEHADLIGDDSQDPSETGTRRVWQRGLGTIHANMAPFGAILARSHTFDVPNSALNEDPKAGHADEIIARITLTPTPAAVVGPIDSAAFAVTLG